MTSPYDAGLDKNPANHQPLTPLTLLERAAAVFPDQAAIVHGPLVRNYRDFYARSRRLASALAKAKRPKRARRATTTREMAIRPARGSRKVET